MANPNNPYGFRYIGNRFGSAPAQAVLYCIPQANTAQLGPGDAVIRLASGDANGVPYIRDCTGAVAPLGVIQSILLLPPTTISLQAVVLDDIDLFAPATKTHDYYAMVIEDQDAMYAIQGDSSAANQVAAACNLNASFTVAVPGAPRSLSASVLSGASIATTNTLNLQIHGLYQEPGNTYGAYAQWMVSFNLYDSNSGVATGRTGV